MSGTSRAAGIVVVILASALGLSVVIFSGAAAFALDSEHLTLSNTQTSLITGIIGGILGALATYLGIHRAPDTPPPPATPPSEETPPTETIDPR